MSPPPLLLEQAMVDPATLIPHPGNPRVHRDAILRDSVKEFGLYRAVVVNKRTGRLVAGHGTVTAFAAERPGQPIQVSYVDVDEDTADRILLMDNRSSDLAGNDDRLLAELLGSLPDLDHTGYQPGDLEDLLGSLVITEPAPPEDFNEYGDDIATQYGCPSCGYEWSGKPHPNSTGTHQPPDEAGSA